MADRVESEVKLRVEAPAAARAALERLGARQVRARHFEDNTLFDRRGSLARTGRALRLRRTDRGGLLTFKGPRLIVAPGVKSRVEIETPVADADALEGILRALGYRKLFRYQKYREVFAWGQVEIVIDETPMGTFLEIEGPVEAIHAAASALGRAPKEFITDSYAGLFFASGGTGDMVFP